jgi:hypothetical protein
MVADAPKRRYLTKTRFILAMECPTKLKYLADARYANRKEDNDFLSALAENGHQVGALAKTLLGNGVQVAELDTEAALERTDELLANENALIFEAALRWQNCFVRVDLLEKRGNCLSIYEVKAKSFDPEKGESQIVGKKGGLSSEFKPYVYDVAFQRYVARRAFPNRSVTASLVFVNKKVVSPEPVLQRLSLHRSGRRVEVEIEPSLNDGKAAKTCLVVVPADAFADQAEREPLELGARSFSFIEGISELMERMNGEPFAPRPGGFCKSCEFRALPAESKRGMLDGRVECWSSSLGMSAQHIQKGSILDLYKSTLTDQLMRDGKLRLIDLEEADIKLKEDPAKISESHRRWLQCCELRGEIEKPWHRQGAIAGELAHLRYPLHFIDFETARPVLPLHSGRRPYEQILFQFSHHTIDESGIISHTSEYLYGHRGNFPNYEVLAALRQAIGHDEGTILHWWDHERTVLADIKKQLDADESEIPDRRELSAFLGSLLGTPDQAARLFDLGRMVDRNLFIPGTRGSSSIKCVLPELLKQSPQVRDRFTLPIYGSTQGISSHNFKDFVWVRFDSEGVLVDPYVLLGERFSDPDLVGVDQMEEDSIIDSGGAAMVAYGLLESCVVPGADVDKLRRQLLRYCELDTLAMVMVWEALKPRAGQ